MEPIWFDIPNRLVSFRRLVRVTTPEGVSSEKKFIQQKHPVSTDEIKGWLDEFGFAIREHLATIPEMHTGQNHAGRSSGHKEKDLQDETAGNKPVCFGTNRLPAAPNQLRWEPGTADNQSHNRSARRIPTHVN
ncbi:MAG: hypothetical protein JW704_13920 [Anaerolineaceae bacterium]|nr:hypothetical protein [Anaerolineaceae bacterium]MBN2678051.1 hypothetical protein [Anaerolineaceae bacterium]